MLSYNNVCYNNMLTVLYIHIYVRMKYCSKNYCEPLFLSCTGMMTEIVMCNL